MKTTAITKNITKLFTAAIITITAIFVFTSCAGEEYRPRQITDKGIIYQFDYNKNEAIVIGYVMVGDRSSFKSIYIPSTIKTGVGNEQLPVTAIANRALAGAPCEDLFIGNNVAIIGSEAFDGCDLNMIVLEGTLSLPILSSDAFTTHTYQNTALNVRPEFYKEAVESPSWGRFENIYIMSIISF